MHTGTSSDPIDNNERVAPSQKHISHRIGYPSTGEEMALGVKLLFGGGLKLNLGCGSDIRPSSQNWLNADCREGGGVDCVFDISKRFPFADNSFDEIYASHVLEHLANPLDAIMECHRILKPGGRLTIRVPYGHGKHNPELQHKSHFWEHSLDVLFDNTNVGLDAGIYSGQFRSDGRTVLYMTWFHKEIQRHLHIDFFEKVKFRFPFGYKKEIVWVLSKPD